MVNIIKYKNFKIDIFSPILQAGNALLITHVLGRLGHYSLSPQATVLLSLVNGIVVNVAFKTFKDIKARIATIPVSVLTGLAVHRFFYPQVPFNKIIGVKDLVILSVALTALSHTLLAFLKKNDREIFMEVDTISIALNTSVALAITQSVRYLGHYSVSVQTTALLGMTAGLVSAMALEFFKTSNDIKSIYWGSISEGAAAGIAAHRFFYPQIALNKIIGIKDYILLSVVLASVTAFLDYLYYRPEQNNQPLKLVVVGDVSDKRRW